MKSTLTSSPASTAVDVNGERRRPAEVAAARAARSVGGGLTAATGDRSDTLTVRFITLMCSAPPIGRHGQHNQVTLPDPLGR